MVPRVSKSFQHFWLNLVYNRIINQIYVVDMH